MKTNAYTVAIDHIHVSQSAIEAALAAAKLRASKTASSQAKVRYAAIAASVVLAGAASAAYFGSIAGFDLPTKPSPTASPSIGSTEAVKETEHTKGTESRSTAKAETAPHPAEPTEQAESAAETREAKPQSATDTDGMGAPAPTDSAAAITETSVPDSMITPSEPSKPTPTEASPLPEVDSSQLCADGKLYIALAQTGLSQIDDPEAFSDDHLYYIETKFGRYYKIQPPKLNPPVPSWIDQPKSDQTVYLYNSDGEIVGEAPVWW